MPPDPPLVGSSLILTLAHLIPLLAAGTYVVLFPLSVIEGPIVTIIAGFLASLGFVNVFLVYFVLVSGDLTGDFMCYAAGRWGLKWLAGRWGKHVGITPARLLRMDDHFEKHSGKTLLLGKLTLGVGSLALVGAGAAKMKPGRFVFFNALGTLPKSLALLVVGYYFGKAYGQAGSVLNYLAIGMVALVVLGVAAYVISRRLAKPARQPAVS